MRQFKNKKQLIILLLFFISVYIFSLKLIPLIHSYYKLKQISANKSNMEKLLKIKLMNFERIKPIKFKAGNHRFSTNILTVLSYINYLRKSGCGIKVKIIKNNLKNKEFAKNIIQNVPKFNKKTIRPAAAAYKKNALNSKNITVTLDKISNIGIIFSLLKTFEAFPLELKKISINPNSGKNIDAVINMRLISLKGAK